MPKTSEMRESKFLKKEDVGRGLLVTIANCAAYNVAMEGAPEEKKWCLTFQEVEKPLVLNATNIQICEQVCGTDDTDGWIGHRIVLFVDPNVSYGGKLVGGIRARKPKLTAPPPPPPPVVPSSPAIPQGQEYDDDIPF